MRTTTIRIPDKLHTSLKQQAHLKGISLNSLLLGKINVKVTSECVMCKKKTVTHCEACVKAAYNLGKESKDVLE